ncbi:MAG TPA: 4-hydroxy-3-methylbut-2-enyl diphosphate reductase [Dehalococcoidia bacterium]|nr:4-hydroxy-3-methylbut-2-enyl diphosphate reductase [Dehalococcoidia bacterium]
MQVIKAKELGFCMGVRRAVDMMEAASGDLGPITSLGSTVHNPQVVDRLRSRGVEVIATLDAVDARPVAITAHGVGPDVLRQLDARGATVVDTTCPIVTRAQQWAKKLTDEGFGVIVFGDPDHKEVRGILGWANGKVVTMRSADDLDVPLPDWMPSRVGVLSQTTETEGHFARFVERLLTVHMDRISELRVINTLCNATTSQQAATEELAREVDLMIVVGGRESANTRHLAEVAREQGVETYHVESAAEIDGAWLAGHDCVGVAAGASTPDAVIDEVVARIETLAPR